MFFTRRGYMLTEEELDRKISTAISEAARRDREQKRLLMYRETAEHKERRLIEEPLHKALRREVRLLGT